MEVKGIRGASHPTMTENERRNALDYEEFFVLFILEIRDSGDRIYAIANPTAHLTLTPHQKTEYSVSGYADFEIGDRM